MTKAHCSGSRGFTLLELMIVLVIMGFMLVFAGPRIAKNLGSLTLKTTAKKAAACIRYARSQAVNTGSLYRVIFDAEKHRLIVLGTRQTATTGDNATDEEDDEIEEKKDDEESASDGAEKVLRIYSLPEEIRFGEISIGDTENDEDEGDKIYQMLFYPNGTAQGGAVVLTDSRERAYSITVDFLTGAVTIEEPTDE